MKIGDRVRQAKGRPDDIGREGVIAHIGGTIIGGDTLVRVRTDDGATFDCYSRQVVRAGRNHEDR